MRSKRPAEGLLLWLAILIFVSCNEDKPPVMKELSSPSGNLTVHFLLTRSGEPAYRVFYGETVIIDTSMLGFELKDAPPLKDGFRIVSHEAAGVSETWELPWGEQREVADHYREMKVGMKEKGRSGRNLDIIFRAYDDGVAFRYGFPEQKDFREAVILEENSGFRLTGDHEAWWMPGDWDSYEHLYNHTPVSEIDALSKFDPGLNQCHIVENAVHTPFTMRTGDGTYISIHEAGLTDYASMTLIADTARLILRTGLVDSERYGYAVKRSLPFRTPWRMIQVAGRPGGLLESRLILNLNEPNRLGDVSWIKPMKYNGIWWEMHLGVSGWDMEGGKHGATTERAMEYIDFAAENNLGGVLVEGWNTGWDRWTGIPDREGVFDFVTPYADYDLERVVEYAHGKGVEIIMHHETSAAPRTYEHQMDAAYRLMESLGLHYAKLGYVGRIIPDGEHHHGQWMVNHYRKAVETAAKYRVAVNIHEPVKPTGLRRTYPNLLSAEGVRGQEFNAWAADGGNPPEHLTIVPFTRMLAGPVDYTPGIFALRLDPHRPDNRVKTTLAHQLALYVIIYSPVQMAADRPENYTGNPALGFIRDVAVDWEESRVLDAEIGEHVTVARRERDSGNWFLGAITGENPREAAVSFDFLEEGKTYRATVYRDGKDAHWKENPADIRIENVPVTGSSELNLKLVPGGGAAISIIPEVSGDPEENQ